MTIYLDTSALAKLVVAEDESIALRAWLREHTGEPLATNTIGVVELQRTAGRISRAALAVSTRLLARIDQHALTARSIALAAALPPAELRTLDALHIASAAEIDDLTAVVSYDDRMIIAAEDFGLPVFVPR